MTDKTVSIQSDRDMRLVARTGSGHEIVMDDRTGDSGARPTELVIAGLGGCTAMDVLSILRKQRQEVSRLEVHVGATQRDAYPQIFTDIEVVIEVEGPSLSVAAVCQAIELAARKYCSVSAMLAAGETVDPSPLPGHRDGCGPVRRGRRGRRQWPVRPTRGAPSRPRRPSVIAARRATLSRPARSGRIQPKWRNGRRRGPKHR